MKSDPAGTQIPETDAEIDHLRAIIGEHTGLDSTRSKDGEERSTLFYQRNGIFDSEVTPGVQKHFVVIENDEVIEVQEPDLRNPMLRPPE